MKKTTFYPHIFSLATAGVKHHGYQDYIFHPIKTDFIGDSGFGKSMIADMLQLVFVGASEFKPGTDDPNRTPKNMILSGQGHSGRGYVFLNLKMALQAYLTIGVYIETNSNRVRHFIVQAGYNWEGENSLKTYSEPLSYRTTITDGNLLPINDFRKKIENLEGEHRRVINIFNNIKLYHQVLANNHILPINFSDNRQKLKDYAHILYSLARGKSKKTLQNDSERLKTFLFGDQDAKRLLKRFESEHKAWLYSLNDYEQNKEEIKRVQNIGLKLQELENLENGKHIAQEEYLQSWTNHYYYKHIQLTKEIKQLSINLTQVKWKYLMIRHKGEELALAKHQEKLAEYTKSVQTLDNLEKQLLTTLKENQAINVAFDEAEKKYKDSLENIRKLEQVKLWLSMHNNSLAILKKKFILQLCNKEEKKKLFEFQETLKAKKIFSAFVASTWARDYDQAKLETKEELENLEKQIELLEALKIFSDLENPDSLARWALEQGKVLSQVQESVLLHFQGLPRQSPAREEGKQYLPDPAKFFEEIKIKEKDNKGFWLNLSGIQEFVSLKPQHLSDLQDDNSKAYLDNLFHNAQIESENLSNRKKILKELQDVLGYESAREPIELFKRQDEIKNFPIDKNLPEYQKEFDDIIRIYESAKDIREIHDSISMKYSSLKEEKEISDTKKHQLNNDIKHISKELKKTDKNSLLQAINRKKEEILYIEQQLNELNFVDDNDSQEDLIQIAESIDLHILSKKQGELETKINQKKTELISIESELIKAREEYESILARTFIPSTKKGMFDYVSDKEKLNRLESSFKTNYKNIAETYAENEYYRLQGATHIGLLAHTLLPKIFQSPDIGQISITDNITNHLQSINDKNRQINQSRINFLLDIFKKVRNHYQSYLTVILPSLQNFFKTEDTRITGGYQVKLSVQEKYPIGWIGHLRHSLQARIQKQTSMLSNFSEDTPLDNIVFETFKKYTGSQKAPDNIKVLLDPKSYFDLKFELRNANATTQGSTGQSYTAIALLCIARLSLIEGRTGRSGIRFLPIDEAEGIGSNYETLSKLASLYNYQIVSMSIRNVESVKGEEQNTYMLVPNSDETLGINYDPFPILSYGHEQFRASCRALFLQKI